jgi:hypothetical protein
MPLRCRSPPKQGGGIRSHWTHSDAGALPIREARSGATGHVATPEPSQLGRRDLEPLDTWKRRCPPYQGGGIRSHWTHGDTGALPIREAESGATGHVAAPDPTLARRQGPVLQGTWWHVGACPAPCLDLKLVCKGIRSAGYRQNPKTTLVMPPRRTSQRLLPDEGLPQTFDQNQIPFHQSPTQALLTIAEATEHPTFDNIPEIQLQQVNMSTTTAGSNQNGGGTSSTQTNGGAPLQSPSRAPSPVQVIQANAEFNQIQMQD